MRCLKIAVAMVLVVSGALTLTAPAQPPESVPKIAARSKSAVVLVCLPKSNCTGFLISKNPPLVATVAHMVKKAEKPSDLTIRANETGAIAKVKAVHIHKNFNPDQGGKNPYSTDLAILELESLCAGLDNPLPLSSAPLGTNLVGEDIILLGFPFYTTAGKAIEQPEAKLNRTMISRVVGFNWNTDIPLKDRRMLEYRFAGLPGDSGSPVILTSSGEVIGVHNGSRNHYNKDKAITTISSAAMHVAELRSLLKEKKLK